MLRILQCRQVVLRAIAATAKCDITETSLMCILIGSEDRLKIYLAPTLCDVPSLVGAIISMQGPQSVCGAFSMT